MQRGLTTLIAALLVLLTCTAQATKNCDYCDEVEQRGANIPLFGLSTNAAQKAFAKQVAPLFAESANNLLSSGAASIKAAPLGFDEYDQFRLNAVKKSAWLAFQDIYRHNPNDPNLGKIVSLLAKTPQNIPAEELIGQWQCRTHKLAGIGDNITSYRYFKCQLSMKNDELYLQKTSGSQRVHGPAFKMETGFALRGCGYYGYSEELCEYGGGKTNYQSRVSEYDEVGRLVFANKKHGALLLPMPFFESKFDILEFKR